MAKELNSKVIDESPRQKPRPGRLLLAVAAP